MADRLRSAAAYPRQEQQLVAASRTAKGQKLLAHTRAAKSCRDQHQSFKASINFIVEQGGAEQQLRPCLATSGQAGRTYASSSRARSSSSDPKLVAVAGSAAAGMRREGSGRTVLVKKMMIFRIFRFSVLVYGICSAPVVLRPVNTFSEN
jgi:hypothetical protein